MYGQPSLLPRRASSAAAAPVSCILAFVVAACSSSPETSASNDDAGGGGRPVADSGGRDDDGAQSDAESEPDVTADADSNDAGDADHDSLPDTAGDSGVDGGGDAAVADSGATDTAVPDAGGDGCSDKLRFIYVVDKDKQMHQFDPDTGAFTLVGEVDCGESLDTTPSSMAMSRAGVALVNYSDNALQAVDIDDTSCSPSGWRAGTGGFTRFGMGYVADDRSGDETLYISSADTLATIDTSSWRVTEIGPLPSQSELSGTGNGELWGFFPLESPPQLLQLDRSDGSVLNSYDLPPLPPNLDTFAFTAWGGEFYLFYRLSGLGESTTVYRYDRRTGALEQVVSDSGLNIVGAGVSTCAPTSR